jgi:2-oxoglutarate ferredoxin oxidoreductase subunit beta
MTPCETFRIVAVAALRNTPMQVRDRIACGILYQREDIPHFHDRLVPQQGLETTCVEEVRRYDVSEYWKELV